jgi:O-antigen/teichoic acid export membrane protein
MRLNVRFGKFSPDIRKIISNIGWLFADRVLQMGLGLIIGVWVVRYLGPGEFGIFNYAMSFVTMFSPLISMGLDSIVVRDIASDPLKKNNTLGTTFVLSICGAIFSLILSIGFISVLEPNDVTTRNLVIVFALSSLFQSFNTIDLWFQSQLQSKQIIISKRTAYILISVVRITLIQIHAPVIYFAWAIFAESALSSLGIIITYRIKGNKLSLWKFEKKRAKKLLQEGIPLIVSGAAIFIYAKIDKVMLGTFLTDKSQLGYYSAAVRVSEIFDFLPVILASSLLPKLSQMKAKGEDYIQKMQIYFDISIWLWLIVAIPISLFSPFIVKILYGESYEPASLILSLYIWGQFGSNIGMARSLFLTVESKLHYSLYISLIGALINVVINLFLIPRYQALGATIATLITYFVVTILINYSMRELKPIAILVARSFNIYSGAYRILHLTRQEKNSIG